MNALAPYLPRLCRSAALATGVALAWALTWWRAGDVTTELEAVWVVRFAAAVIVVASTFAFDDPSFDVTRACVGTRRLLMPTRLGAMCWAVVVALVPVCIAVGDELSGTVWCGLLLEVIALGALTSGVALLLQRRWRFFEPAQFVVFIVLIVGLYEQLTVGRWPLLAAPGGQWADAHWRWVAIGAGGLVLLAWQLRDPASGSWRRVFSPAMAGVTSRREHVSP